MDQCPICLCDLVTTTGCGHRFHSACLHKWLESKGTCPVCRADTDVARRYEQEIACKERIIAALGQRYHRLEEEHKRVKDETEQRIRDVRLRCSARLKEAHERIQFMGCVALVLLFVVFCFVWW